MAPRCIITTPVSISDVPVSASSCSAAFILNQMISGGFLMSTIPALSFVLVWFFGRGAGEGEGFFCVFFKLHECFCVPDDAVKEKRRTDVDHQI